MDCKSVSKKLYDYLNNELENNDKDKIYKHLHSCRSCNNELKTLRKLKLEFKKNMQNPPSSILYRIKKETKTGSWIDYVLLHKRIFGFSATFAFIIAAMIFFNFLFNKNNFSVNEFLNDIYSFNRFEESINETITTLNIFNNE